MNFIIALIVGAFGYWLWPSGIFDTPLSQLTLGVIASAVVSATLLWGAFVSAIAGFDT